MKLESPSAYALPEASSDEAPRWAGGGVVKAAGEVVLPVAKQNERDHRCEHPESCEHPASAAQAISSLHHEGS